MVMCSLCGRCPARAIDAPGRWNHLKVSLAASLFNNGLRTFAVGDGKSRLGISRHSSRSMNGNTFQGASPGAPLPAWRQQAALDRKRSPDDPVKVGPTRPATSTDHAPSTWKQTALAKKLLKYASPAAATPCADQDRNSGSRGKEDGKEGGVDAKSGVQRPEVRVESTGSLPVDDQDEDRLLPIKQNPILVSDREKRSGSKAERRSKKSSHSSSKVSGSEAAAERRGSADHGALSASANQKPRADDAVEDEVFEREVTYGKGFVHKLLQKFINLSGKEETVSTLGLSKTQGQSRSSGESCGGKTSSSSQHSNCDADNHTLGSLGYSVCESSVQNEKIAGMSSGKILNDKGSKVEREQSTNQPVIDTEEFPQNIVLSTRDIFENSSLIAGKKPPSGVEKLRPEVVIVQTASKKRLAPGVPSTNKPDPLPATEIPRNHENLNRAGTTIASNKTSSVAAVNAKPEPQTEPQQNFQISRNLSSGSGTRKTQPQDYNELERDAGEKDKSTRERSEMLCSGPRDKTDHRSVEVTKPSVMSDVSSALGKVSSVVGSWGLRHSSGTHNANADNDEIIRDQEIEATSAKVKQMKDLFSEKTKPSQNAEAHPHSSGGPSANKETENEQSRPPKFVLGGTKVTVETLSGNFDPVSAGHGAAPKNSSRAIASQSSADVSKISSGLKLDTQREIERNRETNNAAATRIKVGYSSIQPPNNAKLTHSVPTKSSIHAESQVTVIQIGDGLSSATYQNKAENDHRYLKRPKEEHKFEAGLIENLQNHVIDERKSTGIIVGYDENKSGYVENSSRNASIEFDISQNNIKNVAGNRPAKSENLWEDPFAKSLSGANGRNSDPKSLGASRPGKLLIRPASNHPASKTKSEFLTMTKYNDIKKGEFAPSRRPVVTDDDDDWVDDDFLDHGGSRIEDLPDPDQFVIVGGGVSIGRSMLAKTKSGGKLRINFDDLAPQTFEYPSEQSLLAEESREPDFLYSTEDDVEDVSLMPSAGLLSSPALSAGSLSSYTPRSQVDYTLGRDRPERANPSGVDSRPPQSLSQTNGPKSDSSDSATYSSDISADLLF